jgi:hypothetical protein
MATKRRISAEERVLRAALMRSVTFAKVKVIKRLFDAGASEKWVAYVYQSLEKEIGGLALASACVSLGSVDENVLADAAYNFITKGGIDD